MRSPTMFGLSVGLFLSSGHAYALDEVILGTNWKAQAEHGGFYQAVATEIYDKYGLDVTIRPGGPGVNNAQMLAAGRIDFNVGGNIFEQFNLVETGIPVVTVAAIYQKAPFSLIAHPDQGYDDLADLKGRRILISHIARGTIWEWLKAEYGFTDVQMDPYNANPAAFLADPEVIQQGYVTSEPFVIEREGGFEPQVFLLADHGYDSYGGIIQTTQQLARDNPDLVQRFVNGSIEGWYSYLYGDPSPANELIKQDNPDMTDALIAYSMEKLKEYGIVDSREALLDGIGAMSDQRWHNFFQFGVETGLYPADLDFSKGYTVEFVNQKVGMDHKLK